MDGFTDHSKPVTVRSAQYPIWCQARHLYAGSFKYSDPSSVRHQLQAVAVLGNCLNSHTCEILTFHNIFICCQAMSVHTSVNAALKLHWPPVFGCRVHHVIDTGLGFLGFGSSQHTPTPNYQWTQQQNDKHYDEQMKLFFLINKN
jgi:hypothetical protein